MMKSFFKKLALVMALAMVVTSAAPAANAFAAVQGIALQAAKSDAEVLTADTIAVNETKDYKFYGFEGNWRTAGLKWTSSNEAVATVVSQAGEIKGVAAGTATITLASADGTYKVSIEITVPAPALDMDAKQKTEDDIYVTFAETTNIPKTGEGLSVFRVFSAEEMSTMTEDDKKGLVVNEDGEGYAQWYVVSASAIADTDNKEYSVAVYEDFKDGATYAVVLGDNAKTWEIEGIETEVRFIASVGKPVDLVVIQTQDGMAPTETDEAVPAVIKTKFLDIKGIDVTNLYSQDDVGYEIVANEDLGYLSSNNEITFALSGSMLVEASYVYYDELAEKDVDVVSSEPGKVVCLDYAAYTGATLYQWSLVQDDGDDDLTDDKVDWSKPDHDLPAGDEGYYIVVVLKDARGQYLTNYPAGTKTKVANTDKYATLIDYSNYDIPFVNYGFSVQFDTLDSNNLLVGREDARVYTYTDTRSYAVAYLYKDDETKVGEMGIMPINVTEAREFDYFTVDKNSLTLLKESEAEDGNADAYHDKFCIGKVKFITYDQYKTKTNYTSDYEFDFTVTPTKNAKNETVITICDTVEAQLNAGIFGNDCEEEIIFDSVDFGDLTSVSFKVTENNTKCSEVITIAISEPKYCDDKTTVYVDPTRAILESANKTLFAQNETAITLFQVSKSGQKVGYFRLGDAEDNANDGKEDNNKGVIKHGYYISNYLYKDISTNIYTLISKDVAKGLIESNSTLEVFYKDTVKDSETYGEYLTAGTAIDYYTAAYNDALADATDPTDEVAILKAKGVAERALRKLYFKNIMRDAEADEDIKVGDYVLFVTNPKGKAFTATNSGIGLSYADGDTEVTVTVADVNADTKFTTYAEAGTYKVNVYKVEKLNTETGKITYKSVVNTSFNLTSAAQTVKYYHQTAKKSVDYSLSTYDNVIDAIEETMTFTVNGEAVAWGDVVDGEGTWTDKNNLDWDGNTWEPSYKIEIAETKANGDPGVTYIEKDGYVTINTVTFRVWTALGGYYETTVNVGRSIYEAE